MDFVNRFSGGAFENVRPATILKFTDLDPRVQQHLQRVYATLTCALAVCTFGVYANVAWHVGGLFTMLAGVGCLATLVLVGESSYQAVSLKRYGLLAGFAFCQGTLIGPLVNMALSINSGLIFTALLGTTVVFGCFSLSALLTRRRTYLFLGGWLSSAVLVLFAMRMSSWIFGFKLMQMQLELYFGLIVFSLYVLFDTQIIVEKASAGDFDHIKHAVDLFIDFIAVFVRVLVILMNNSQKREEKKEKKR